MVFNSPTPLFVYGNLSIKKLEWLCVNSHKTQGVGTKVMVHLRSLRMTLIELSVKSLKEG